MEAKRLRLPTIGFINAYFGHWMVDYPILGNMNRRTADYYTYLFEEMRMLLRSFVLHRYAIRRSKLLVYKKVYEHKAVVVHDSNLPSSLASFIRFGKNGMFAAFRKARRKARKPVRILPLRRRPKRLAKKHKAFKNKTRKTIPNKWLGSKL